MKKIESYDTAIHELKGIVDALEEESTSIDSLYQKVERAGELLSFCKSKLRKTDEDVRKIVDDF